jgi:hypothetical protein
MNVKALSILASSIAVINAKQAVTLRNANVAAESARRPANDQARKPSRLILKLDLIRLVVPLATRPIGLVFRDVLSVLHVFLLSRLPKERRMPSGTAIIRR